VKPSPVLGAIARTAARLCDAQDAMILQVEGDTIRHVAKYGRLRAIRDVGDTFPLSRDWVGGRAIIDRKTVHIRDMKRAVEREYRASRAATRVTRARTFLATPLVRGGTVLGAILIRRTTVRPFTARQITLLKTFADQAAIAIENTRLVGELAARNVDLTEALEQQVATSEILRVISNSPTDIESVLATVVESAARLCRSVDGNIFRVDGDRLVLVAHYGPIPAGRIGEFTLRLVRGTVGGRTALERRAIHVVDLQAAIDEFPDAEQNARTFGLRTMLSVPLLRGDAVLGVIQLRRVEVNPFTDRQVDLLKTFADQAVIAFENVRLFKELRSSNHELRIALEQQTATSDLLKVIGRSTFDLGPVFDTLAENAVRLCEAERGFVHRFDGRVLRVVATHNVSADRRAFAESHPIAPGRDSAGGRACLERRTIHIRDVQNDPDDTYAIGQADAEPTRTLIAVPMLRADELLGVITIYRFEVRPFTDNQVALLETFADQAAIAIENARLLSALQAKNADLTEALEQQTATSEILRVISSSPTDLQPVFDSIAASATRLCDALFGLVFRLESGLITLVAHDGATPEQLSAIRRVYPMAPGGQTVAARAIHERRVIAIEDSQTSAEYPHIAERARSIGYRSLVSVPMLRGGVALGAINVVRAAALPFTETQIELLKTFADQAVIAIENVRLFSELEARNRELTTALDRETATGEILRVISSSPTDAQPVFDSVVASAARLCGAVDVLLAIRDGDALRIAAGVGSLWATVLSDFRVPLVRGSVAARSVIDGVAVHVADLAVASENEFPEGRDMQRQFGHRTVLAVPLRREAVAVGTIFVMRFEVQPFTDAQIALLETFADQAMIAVENVRLFRELEERNRALGEALEQQTATAEVLKVISRSTFDLQPVLDTLIENATKLCGARRGVIMRRLGDTYHGVAFYNVSAELIDYVARHPVTPGRGSITGRVALERRTIHVSDLQADPDYDYAQSDIDPIRTELGVPMFRGDDVLGVIILYKLAVEPFTGKQIELVETFADQAVIAIENVRLFKELQARNRELTRALDHQTATADILRVISRSYTDLDSVFQVIVDSAKRLLHGNSSVISRIVDERIELQAYTRTDAAGDALLESFFPIPLQAAGGDTRPIRERVIGGREPYNVADVETDARVGERGRASARARAYRSQLVVPMLRDDDVIGTIAVTRPEPGAFVEDEIALLRTFADQAVIAIENVRLFTELQARNRDLTTALDRETATAELLRVISQAQTDVQPVFEAIADSVLRLLGAWGVFVFRYDGELIQLAAARGGLPGSSENAIRSFRPQPLTLDTMAGRTMLTRTVQHVVDIETDSTWGPYLHESARSRGWRSTVQVPMLSGDDHVGSIGVSRAEPGGFSPAEITLLQTFADQAVIAVKNARLLEQLQARTAQLSRSVDELTALGEVSRTLSSTLDLEAVLNTIVARASDLTGSDYCAVWEYEEAAEMFSLRAISSPDPEVVAAARNSRFRRGEGVQGQMAVTHEPVQVPDITAGQTQTAAALRDVLLRTGTRALLAVPLLRDDRLMGGLTINKNTPGEFPPETVELLKTFAVQSALAINNARLFREIEEKGRQLEIASRHKSQFLANMSHELRTPLNAILGYTELIVDNIYGEVPERMREVLERVDRSGRHLLGLINDILDLSKIEAGQLTLALGPYSMDGVAQTVATQVGALAAEKRLAFELVLAEDVPIGQGDERRLTQVLLNLVGNAIKFTDAGRVVVRVEASGGNYLVSVADTGPGIAEADREKIFEEFQQADTTRAKAKGGTGLGLAISRRIVEMHGGRLWVESTLGEGSTFSFTVPVHVDRQVSPSPAGAPA
jgi:GAF domain-containing protein/anti-sigma regulatory factor (Ser/Thr protein kinase)